MSTQNVVSFVLMFSKIFCKNIKYRTDFGCVLSFFGISSFGFFNDSFSPFCCAYKNVLLRVFLLRFQFHLESYRLDDSHKAKIFASKTRGKWKENSTEVCLCLASAIRMECALKTKHRYNSRLEMILKQIADSVETLDVLWHSILIYSQ